MHENNNMIPDGKATTAISVNSVIVKFFGTFSITTNLGTLTESEITSSLAIRLIVFLLSNSKRKVSKHELANILWTNMELVSPIKQVQNTVYRTRKILAPISLQNLISSDRTGNYFINPYFIIITDTDIFDHYYNLGIQSNIPQKDKIAYLTEAIRTYTSDFLPNYIGDTWLDNQRTYYHLSYLQAVLILLPLLYQEQSYSKIHDISSAALLHEPDNSDIHFWHIRAMYNLGGIDVAQKHFLQHSSKLYDEQRNYLKHILFTT